MSVLHSTIELSPAPAGTGPGMADWLGVDMANGSAEERFWAKVQKTDTCWLYTAGWKNQGYGMFYVDAGRHHVLAHRYSYELAKGPIPDGLEIDHRHTCPKNCVNPDHLRLATRKQQQENLAGALKTSSSGYRGVDRLPSGGWRARVQHNGRTIHVGCFRLKLLAVQAAQRKRIELFTHNDRDRGVV
jgi:hypothetical protein